MDFLFVLVECVWCDWVYGDVYVYMLFVEGWIDMVVEFGVKEYDIVVVVVIVCEVGGRMIVIDGVEMIFV